MKKNPNRKGVERMLLTWNQVTGTGKEFRLKEISFSLEAGYLMVLAGPNGAGKTTLFRYMLEEKKNYTGEILLDGCEIYEDHKKTLNEIGYVSEENSFFEEYTAMENARLLSVFYKEWEEELFIQAMKDMELSVNKTVGTMSRGEAMKFQMAFAMAHKPKLYLLDEATGGMDPVFRKDFYKIIRKILEGEHASVVMTTHIQEEIEKQADYVGIMENGKILRFGENREDGSFYGKTEERQEKQ